MPDRPIESITLSEWCELAEAAISLLSMARFMMVMSEDRCDGTESESVDRMAHVLAKIGMDQGSTAAWVARLDEVLQSGLPPEEWAKRRELMEQAGGMKQ